VSARAVGGRTRPLGLSAALAWRNLWRNPRRSWLTAAGVAFAVFLLVAARSLQMSGYTTMLDNATRLLVGHVQIQDRAYFDDPSLRHVIADAASVVQAVAALPAVAAVAPRALAFALISSGERSYGAQVMGVDPEAETKLSSLPEMLIAGTYLAQPGDAVVGVEMARNLGAILGDELVVLGSTREGGVAAMSVRIGGIVDTGSPDLDRALVQVRLGDFQDAFELHDEVNIVVARVVDFSNVRNTLPELAQALTGHGSNLTVVPWQRLLPEIEQTIALKNVVSEIMFGLVAVLVGFSVFNTFIMLVFERTREFGMLLAIGMRPGAIVGLLQLEAAWLALLGAAIGLASGAAVVVWLGHVGIPLGDMAGEMLRRYHLPDRIYPLLHRSEFVIGPLVMLCATQLAALIPALRIRKLAPVQVMRVGA
jgi:putative ABC transport system permease protein